MKDIVYHKVLIELNIEGNLWRLCKKVLFVNTESKYTPLERHELPYLLSYVLFFYKDGIFGFK